MCLTASPQLCLPSAGLQCFGTSSTNPLTRQACMRAQVCDALTAASAPLCPQCCAAPELAASVLAARAGRLERAAVQMARICHHCGGGAGAQGDLAPTIYSGVGDQDQDQDHAQTRTGPAWSWTCRSVSVWGVS